MVLVQQVHERERAYRLYSLDNLQRAAGMVPLSELSWRLLFVIHGKDHASRKKLLRGSNSTYNCRRFARSPSSSGIIPVSWLLSNALHGCRRRMVKITPPIDSLSKQAALIVCIQSINQSFIQCLKLVKLPERGRNIARETILGDLTGMRNIDQYSM